MAFAVVFVVILERSEGSLYFVVALAFCLFSSVPIGDKKPKPLVSRQLQKKQHPHQTSPTPTHETIDPFATKRAQEHQVCCDPPS
jgi:hypothetical protein